MMRPSWLDAIVQRFQHNWETNPQYRAIVSGVAGLVIVVGLCATMGVAAVFASNIGASIGGAGSGNGGFISQSGPNAQATDVSFPMTTLTPWPAPNIPGAQPIPASKTPQPSPTPAPTATPAPTDTPCVGQGCGGGGGGGGGGGSVTGSAPAPLKGGAAGAILVNTKRPNQQILININWPNGAPDFPAGSGSTDSSGNGTISVGIVPACPAGHAGQTLYAQVFVYASDGSQFSGSVGELC